MGIVKDSVSVSALEDLMRAGARALIDRLGYAMPYGSLRYWLEREILLVI